ncbi:MAG: UDP-N-acetylmuramoylalanine--D-glutamate ligase [Legionellales bacterium RIFCSPHIGHO2_12_FULL_35_11]|nr:MAG: UDP-N-acetylmuramoylalanine--D-glutamate ligase [Legionellales bacterium RIFCSPHIGHO2_12_FULL_35_11]
MDENFYLIIGLGKTGYSVARYLQRKNINFAVFDTRNAISNLAEFQDEFPGINVFLGTIPENILFQISTAILSPGVDLNLPEIQKIKQHKIQFYGDIECLAKEEPGPVVAITGTNGKSTVTTLVGEMAKNFDVSVAVAGNIGRPVLDLLDNDQQYGLWVLELSSFQLDLTSSLKPLAATILNITEDHLDRHASYAEYVKVKQRIYRGAKFVLYNREDKQTIPENISEYSKEFISSYGFDEPKEGDWGLREYSGRMFISHGNTQIMPVDELKVKGRHNLINVLAACALANSAGISHQAKISALQDFKGLKHRTQWLRTLNGVDWIDDSKGTNVGATIAAISGLGEAIDGEIILIAGGQGKGADFTQLRPAVTQYVRAVVLYGEDANIMADALVDTTIILRATNIQEAVAVARDEAYAKDSVLLSPACASFDMFRDFNHRGEVFSALVEELC